MILVTFLFCAGFLAIKNRVDELAGVLFAFSTIKPQLALLICAFVLIWSIRQKRWRIVTWLLSTTALLVAGAFLLMPDWLLQNLREVVRYPTYNPPGTFGTALAALLPGIGRQVGWLMSGLLTLVLLIEWFLSKQGGYRNFLWTACITLTASQWIGIQTDPRQFLNSPTLPDSSFFDRRGSMEQIGYAGCFKQHGTSVCRALGIVHLNFTTR